jgi:hypothetical protein
MSVFNQTITVDGAFDVVTTYDDVGNRCTQSEYWSVSVTKLPDAPWPKTTSKAIAKSKSKDCYGVVKKMILDTVPEVDGAEIDWILSYMNFGPPKRAGGVLPAIQEAVAKMKNLKLSEWLDTAVGCLSENRPLTDWMCEIAENPDKFRIPNIPSAFVGGGYPQWDASNYAEKEMMSIIENMKSTGASPKTGASSTIQTTAVDAARAAQCFAGVKTRMLSAWFVLKGRRSAPRSYVKGTASVGCDILAGPHRHHARDRLVHLARHGRRLCILQSDVSRVCLRRERQPGHVSGYW